MSISVRGLRVDLGGREVLSGLDLDVPNGQFTGLLGPNGSGKSTLLKTVYRVHRPREGEIALDGTSVSRLSTRDCARRIAVVAQENTVEFDFTVVEIVRAGRIPHKGPFERDTAVDHEIVADSLDRVGCTALTNRRFHSLSGGEKQRVLIARALAQQADHLILDEPTNHLDIRYQVELLELVASLGVTVLAALHDLSLAALFCDTVHLLSDGEVLASGPPAQVLTAEAIHRSYGAHVLVLDHSRSATPHIVPLRSPQEDR
jgi:iron complex transport system ATP-binding protein